MLATLRQPFFSQLLDLTEAVGKDLFYEMNKSKVRAIFTDVQFWVPLVVLGLGILLLIYLH